MTKSIYSLSDYANYKVLYNAVKNKNIEAVKTSLKQGADLALNGNELMKLAIDSNLPDIVRLLIDYGCDIHFDEDYALRVSAQKGNFDNVKIAVEFGADIKKLPI